MDHIHASRSVGTRKSLPYSRQDLSTSVPPDRSRGGAVEATDEGLEGIVDKLVVTDRGYQAQPVRTLSTGDGVKSHHDMSHLAAEELVLQHGRGAR